MARYFSFRDIYILLKYILHCNVKYIAYWWVTVRFPVALFDFVLLENTSNLSSLHGGKVFFRCRLTDFRKFLHEVTKEGDCCRSQGGRAAAGTQTDFQ